MTSQESVLITGCSDGGLGAALTTSFHARGYRVFATSRSLDTMTKVSGLSGVRVLKLDVTSVADLEAAKTAVSEETGGSLSYLVNCAARNHFMPLLDESIENAKLIHDTNVWGPLAVTQAFAPLLIKAKGSAVFITSVAGHLNTPYQGKVILPSLVLRLLIDRRHRLICCFQNV
jgi:1-acylglycerone phosphate reductase